MATKRSPRRKSTGRTNPIGEALATGLATGTGIGIGASLMVPLVLRIADSVGIPHAARNPAIRLLTETEARHLRLKRELEPLASVREVESALRQRRASGAEAFGAAWQEKGRVHYGVVERQNPGFGSGRLGSGSRFERCVEQMSRRPDIDDPRGLCATIGRRKYGKARFQRLAAAHRLHNPEETIGIVEDEHGHLVEILEPADGAYVLRDEEGASWFGGCGSVEQAAQAGADLLFQSEQANPRRRRSNPQDGAEALYEEFHGRPSSQTVVIEEPVHEHGWTAALGRLVQMTVKTETGVTAELEFPDEHRPYLTSSEDGKQLYIDGGDQAIDLRKIKMDSALWRRDDMLIGEIHKITYQTEKGFDNFEVIDYYHHLGEDTKVRPWLRYDPRSERLYITGGQYSVRPEGIVN